MENMVTKNNEEGRAEVNIEQIMREIRADIKARGLTNSIPSMQEIAAGNLEYKIQRLIETSEFMATPVITPRKGFKGKVVALIKRLVRSATAFIWFPLISEQQEYRRMVSECMRALYMENVALRERINNQEEG